MGLGVPPKGSFWEAETGKLNLCVINLKTSRGQSAACLGKCNRKRAEGSNRSNGVANQAMVWAGIRLHREMHAWGNLCPLLRILAQWVNRLLLIWLLRQICLKGENDWYTSHCRLKYQDCSLWYQLLWTCLRWYEHAEIFVRPWRSQICQPNTTLGVASWLSSRNDYYHVPMLSNRIAKCGHGTLQMRLNWDVL